MTRVFNSIKLDFLAGRFYLTLYPLFFVLAWAIGTFFKMPIFTVVLVIVLAVFIAGGVFASYERNHGEKLHGTLPLKKSDIVVGRYLYGLAIGLAGTVVAGLLGYLATWVGGSSMASFGPNRPPLTSDPAIATMLFWGAVGAALLYFCFSLAVAFPIYFRFGFSRSYIFTMLPLYLIIIAVLLITRLLHPSLGLNDTIQFLIDHVYLLPLIGLVAGVILWGISLLIARVIYARKEI